MTDTPADPIAAEAREIAARVLTEHFEAELNRSPSDPIGARTRLTDRMAAAFGHRMKAAGRAEASAVVEAARYANDPKNQISEGLFCLVPLRLALREYDAALPPPPEGGE